jgi:hypothetical protein
LAIAKKMQSPVNVKKKEKQALFFAFLVYRMGAAPFTKLLQFYCARD